MLDIRDLKARQPVSLVPYRGVFYFLCLFFPLIYTACAGRALYIYDPVDGLATAVAEPEQHPIPADSIFHLAGTQLLEQNNIVSDGTYLFVYTGSQIVATRQTDNSHVWSFPIENLTAAFGLQDGVLYAAQRVVTDDATYRWIGIEPPTGELLWESEPIALFSKPDLKYPFIQSFFQLRWIDVQTGELLWEIENDRFFGLQYSFERDGRLYLFFSADGVLMVVDAETGIPVWKTEISGGAHTFSADYFTSFESIDENSDQLCVRRMATAERLWCIPRVKKEPLNAGWESQSISAVIDGSTLILKPEWYQIEAFDLETGVLLWSHEGDSAVVTPTDYLPRGSRFVALGDMVYYNLSSSIVNEGPFYAADRRTGQIAWQKGYDLDFLGTYKDMLMFARGSHVLFVDTATGEIVDVIESHIADPLLPQVQVWGDNIYLYGLGEPSVAQFVPSVTDADIREEVTGLIREDRLDEGWALLSFALKNKGGISDTSPLAVTCKEILEPYYINMVDLFEKGKYGRVREYFNVRASIDGRLLTQADVCPTMQAELANAYWLAGQSYQRVVKDESLLFNPHFQQLEIAFPDAPQTKELQVLKEAEIQSLRSTYWEMLALNLLLVCVSSLLTIQLFSRAVDRSQALILMLILSNLFVAGVVYLWLFQTMLSSYVLDSPLTEEFVWFGSCVMALFVSAVAYIYTQTSGKGSRLLDFLAIVVMNGGLVLGLTYGVLFLALLW